MGFGKRKKEEKPVISPVSPYINWEADFGFLQLILTRKKGISKEFLINILDKQREKQDYLSDDDIDPIIRNAVHETIKAIGDNYKDFLITKYFGTKENLIAFIAEDITADLTIETINKNSNKIKKNIQEQAIKVINKFNNKK